MLIEVLAPSFEVEFLVESRPLARRLARRRHARRRRRPAAHRHLPQGRPRRPAPASSSKTTATQGPQEDPRSGARRRRHAGLRARHRADAPSAEAETSSAVPRGHLPRRWPSCSAARSLTELGRSLTRARVQQYQRYFERRGPRPDPAAQRSRSRRDGQRPRAAQRAAPHQADRHHRRLQGVTRPENLRMVQPARHPRRDGHAGVDFAEFDRIAMVDVQPHYFGGLLQRVDLVDRPPSRAGRLQRGVQGHPRRLRLDVARSSPSTCARWT